MFFKICKDPKYPHEVKGKLDHGLPITIKETPYPFDITSSSQVLRIWSTNTNAPLKFTFKEYLPDTPPTITVTIGED